MFRIFWGILFLVLAPQMVFAKDKANQSWDNLSRLQAGQKVQVVQMDMKSLKGTFVGFSEEALSLRIKKDEVAVARADVLRVSLRGKGKRGKSALVGAGLGALMGAIGGAGFGAAALEDADFALIVAPMGAGVGAALGAAAPFAGYETVYRAKRKRGGTRP